MSTTAALRFEDFVALPDPPDGIRYELSEGELITLSGEGSIYIHEFVKSKIHRALDRWVAETGGGLIFSEAMYKLSDVTARRPDVSYVSQSRLAGIPVENKRIPFVPDLAVEVISESERASSADLKVRQYLKAGITEVWQVYPETRAVFLRNAQGTRELRAEDVLETSALPGFRVTVAEFFP